MQMEQGVVRFVKMHPGAWSSTRRKLGLLFAPLSGAPGAISPKIVSPFPITLPSFVNRQNPSSLRDACENVSQTHYNKNIGVTREAFSP